MHLLRINYNLMLYSYFMHWQIALHVIIYTYNKKQINANIQVMKFEIYINIKRLQIHII